MENSNNRSALVNGAVRVLAIVGFIALIIGGLWGSVAVARAVPGAFSALASAIVSVTSVFVPADETITLSLPSSTVQSGQSFVLSWNHVRKSTEGVYTLSAQCANGVSFTTPTNAGVMTDVPCETSFAFLNANDSVVLTAYSTDNRFADVVITIEFTPDGASTPTVSGSTTLTVENPAATGTTTGTTSTGTTVRTPGTETTSVDVFGVTGPTASDPNGYIDLSVRLIEIGVVDKATGEFTASSTPSRSMIGVRVAARFAVENVGTRTSDQWTFNAVLPTFPSHIYSSPTQQALGPGDRIEFTLGFDSFEEDNEGTLVINVDPTQRINERNKDNNILRQIITVAK